MMAEGVRPWDVLALATFAPLGAFGPVRLSPNLGPADLGVAAAIPLPRGPGEFLVAAISDSPGPDSMPVLLTTHRVIWFERFEPAPGAADPRPVLNGRMADFLDLGPEVSADGDAVDLGRGRVVELPPGNPGLAETLATALRALHRAATTGVAPPIDPALADRIAAAIPKAREVDARLSNVGEERARFRDELLAASPHAYATPTIIAACVAVWGAMVASGVSPAEPDSEELIAWGANGALRVALKGEAWRLPASVFLHGGILHLAVNMWALAGIGPMVERLYGTLRFSALYLAAGVGGALASTMLGPARVSVGASGAIFGVLGALLAFLLAHRRAIPASILKPMRSQIIALVVFNVAFGAAVPAIDQAAHLGGLATGFLAGLALAPPWPRRGASTAGLARSILACGAVAAVVTVACGVAIERRADTLAPMDLFRDLAIQLAPIEDRQIETVKGVMEIAEEIQSGDDETVRVDLAARLAEQEREGRAVLVTLGRVWTPDARLRAVVDRLAEAQREQIAAVEAARQYVRSGDPRDLEGPKGFARHAEAMARSRASAIDLQESFLRENRLVEPADGP